MADKKDAEASRVALEEFIPEFNRPPSIAYARPYSIDDYLCSFPGRPLEVSYDSKYGESDYYGGGSSHSGQQQQQSVYTIVLDTDDLHPPDSNVTTQ